MDINGKTRICGLIGKPVGHTLSPVIHNTLASDIGDNLVYVPLLVEKDLKRAVEGAYALDFLGLNVTVPYKNEVIPLLSEIDRMAEQIGAVNTLVRIGEGGINCNIDRSSPEDHELSNAVSGYKGYNTDILGLKRALAEEGILLKGKTVVIIGAGGAARAAAFLCASEGAAHTYIMNRTAEKAVALKSAVLGFYPEARITAGALDDIDNLPVDGCIALQCTSVGLYPGIGESPVASKHFPGKVSFAFDLIYNPDRTAFLKSVSKAGGRTANGLNMLLWQGIASYELWTGRKIEPDEAAHVKSRLIEAL